MLPGQEIKIDKTILNLVSEEGFNQQTPLYTKTLINFYRIFTIAIKDVIWQEEDFKACLQKNDLQFLRHIRNASAHDNKFYWGKGKERERTLKQLPITWRNKTITQNLEGTTVFMDFIKPGDIFILLSDVTDSCSLK